MIWFRELAQGLFHWLAQVRRHTHQVPTRRRGQVVCLTAHSFTADRRPGCFGEQPIGAFCRFVDAIQAEAAFTDIDSALDFSRNSIECAQPPHIVLTVDDGYSDNFDVLRPALESRGIRGTFFVTTNFIDTGTPPWPVEIRAILEAAEGPAMAWPWAADISSLSKRASVAHSLKIAWAGLTHSIRSDHLAELRRHVGAADLALPRPMTWGQLRSLRQAGHTIGSHTDYHGILTELDDDEVRHELIASKERIEAELGGSCDLIAYPNGDWDQRVGDLAKAAGYSYGFTQRFGRVSDHADGLSLPRINLPPYRYSPSLIRRVADAL